MTLRNQAWWKSLHGEVKRPSKARTIGLFEVFDWIDPWHLGTVKLCTSGNSTQFPRGSRPMAVCESHVAAASVLYTPQSAGTQLIGVILTAASWSFWSKTTVTPRYSHQIRSCHHACGARAASGAQFCWRGSAYWVNVGEKRSYWVNVGLIIVKFMVKTFFFLKFYFPTCQVRVVRFYQSCSPPPPPPPPSPPRPPPRSPDPSAPPRAPDPSGHCRTSTPR